MEDQLNFVLKLSLEEMALRRVVVNLWTGADTLATIKDFLYDLYSDDWFGLGWEYDNDTVKSKVWELEIPKPLKERIWHTVTPIGLEISRLLYQTRLRGDSLEDSSILIQHLCWTSAGTVDNRKTAERLVCLKMLDILKRFKLDCLYCLEDYISLLWDKVPLKYKKRFNDLNEWHFIDIQMHLEFYWAYVLKGDISKLHSFVSRIFDGSVSIHEWCFHLSARAGEKAATEYFLQKLTKEERDYFSFELPLIFIPSALNATVFGIPKPKFSEIFCFMLCAMTPADKMKIFIHHLRGILQLLLTWPWQDVFFEVADLFWTFLPESSYSDVLNIITTSFRSGQYFFPNFLQKFFLCSPRDFRKLLAFHLDSFFSVFACLPDTKTFEVIFRNLDLGDKAELAFSDSFAKLLYFFVANDEWDIVEVCLREILLTKEERERFREASEKLRIMISSEDEMYETRKWKRFCELLDNTEANSSIKKISGEPLPEVRKLS